MYVVHVGDIKMTNGDVAVALNDALVGGAIAVRDLAPVLSVIAGVKIAKKISKPKRRKKKDKWRIF